MDREREVPLVWLCALGTGGEEGDSQQKQIKTSAGRSGDHSIVNILLDDFTQH